MIVVYFSLMQNIVILTLVYFIALCYIQNLFFIILQLAGRQLLYNSKNGLHVWWKVVVQQKQGNKVCKVLVPTRQDQQIFRRTKAWARRYLSSYPLQLQLEILICSCFYCTFLSLCWKVVLPSPWQSLKTSLSLVILKSFTK